MALPEFSTLLSVQQRANKMRVLGWTDKNADAIPDEGTLTQGFQFASGLIFEHLTQRYGETELASWTLATAPARILRLSDDLCLWYFSSSNNAQSELIQLIYKWAITSLENIRDYTSHVYGASESVATTSATVAGDDLDDPFDVDGETPVYFNS